MKKKLEDYIIKTSFLNTQFCDDTIKHLKNIEKNNWQQHTFYNPQTGKESTRSGNYELDVLFTDQIVSTKIIMDNLRNEIGSYLEKLNFPWFNGWSGYTGIRYNRYIENRKMALHCDHIHSMFDGDRKGIPILSCLGVLNDDYEGGEFLMFDDYEIKLKQGDLIIFPSNFLYPHKVEPVTKGTRYSYISWVW